MATELLVDNVENAQTQQRNSRFNDDMLARRAALAQQKNAENIYHPDRLLINPATGQADFMYSSIHRDEYITSAPKMQYSKHVLRNWDVEADRAAALQLEQTRGKLGAVLGAPNAAIGAVPLLAATQLSPILTTSVSIKNLAIASSVSATINGSINAGQQYYKYGEIKYPAELVISTAMGSLEGSVGAYGGVFFNGVVGASSNAITASIVNDYYNYDKDHNGEIYTTTAVGFGFGAGGKYVDDKYISPFLSKYFKF